MNRLIKQKLWMDVIRLRNAKLTYAEIGRLMGITRQRACQIVIQAKAYAGKHDDELAKYIAERTG
ncbi:MAG: sigma factor-like helix-turn-helix DNA-binding protein [Saccharofermentanales bacterium]